MTKVATSLPVRVLVTVALLAALAAVIDWAKVSAALAGARWGWAVVAVGLVFVGSIAAAWRWRVFLLAGRLTVSFRRTLRAYFAGAFANNFLPTGFGGDVVRGALVAPPGRPLARALTSVLADRWSALGCLLILGWVAAGIDAARLPGSLVAGLAAASTLAVAAVGAVAFALRRRGLGRYLPPPLRPWAGEAASVLRAYLSNRRLQVQALAIGLAYQVLTVVGLWLIAVALDIDVSLTELTVILPLVVIVAALPISIAGFGVREGAFVILLAPLGVSAADATLLSLLLVATVALASVPGAITLLTAGRPASGGGGRT